MTNEIDPKALEIEKTEKLTRFYEKHADRAQAWKKQHPGFPCPVFWDQVKREWWWANREARKKLRKAK